MRNEQITERPVAIRISGIKKKYRLGQIGGGTLQNDLQSWWARVRRKEDPNTKIGQDQRLFGKTFLALNGIDLTIYKGETVGIIGSNGAGKSTLLKLISRITAPTEGTIDLYGRVASMLEVGTGFNTEMTGRENIYMNGAILGMTRAEIDAKMEDIIDFSEVREFIDTPVKRYSSGMYVKLAFSVAAHLDSEILIMDEVLAVGDLAFQKKCLKRMKSAAETEGRTVLYVSHNMNTIQELCDHCIVLEEGKIIYDGDVETAVSIYSGSEKELKTERVYSKEDHRDFRTDGRFLIRSTKILGKEQPICESGEKMTIEITCESNVDVKRVGFRFQLQYQDGTMAGTMLSENMIDFHAGSTKKVLAEMDTHHLTTGRYRVDIIAYALNGTGTEEYLDGIYPGLYIEVNEALSADNPLFWLHRYWGSTHLHDLILKEHE